MAPEELTQLQIITSAPELYLEPNIHMAIQDECPQTIMYLLSPIDNWSSMWPNGSCNLSDMFTSRKQTPKPAQPNVVGMRTPTGSNEESIEGQVLSFVILSQIVIQLSQELSDDYWQFSPYCLF